MRAGRAGPSTTATGGPQATDERPALLTTEIEAEYVDGHLPASLFPEGDERRKSRNAMDPDRYCLDEAAPPGSSLHYATLFTDPRERAALVAVHALRHVLLGVLDTVADPDVRARKLNWWSNEVMEARDGRPRHPVAVAITRHGAARLWRRPEVLAMLTAIGRVSAAGGFESEADRERFCRDVGGGTARLCAAMVAAGTTGAPDASGARDGIGALGSVLEYAMLAGVPTARSGLMRIPNATWNAPQSMEGATPDAGAGDCPAAGHSPERIGRNGPDAAARRTTGGCAGGGSGGTSQRIAEERARAHQALADALRDMPFRADPVALVYRTLAHLQLAALASALRKPASEAPLRASITPLRKLWIAWRIARGAG